MGWLDEIKDPVKGATSPAPPKSELPVYYGPTEFGNCKGAGCSKIATLEASKLYGVPYNELSPQDAWYKKQAILKHKGKEVWNAASKAPYSGLKVGDFVSLDRPGDYHDYEKSSVPGYTLADNEKVEHVGVVVGMNEKGEPLIKHGSAGGKTYVQPINNINLPEYGFSYKPKSIYRAGVLDKAELKDKQYYTKPEAAIPLAWADKKTSVSENKNKYLQAINQNLQKHQVNLGLSAKDANLINRVSYGIFNNESEAGETNTPIGLKMIAAKVAHKLGRKSSPSLGDVQFKYDDLAYNADGTISKIGKNLEALGVNKAGMENPVHHRDDYNDEVNSVASALAANLNKLKTDPRYKYNPKTNTVYGDIPLENALATAYKWGNSSLREDRMRKHNTYGESASKAMKEVVAKKQHGGEFNGVTTEGFDYNGAWGGPAQNGTSLPGSVGFSYARTGAPSNGKYAKKTLPSAQNGNEKEMERINEEAEKTKYYYNQYMNSPRYKEMLTNSTTPEEFAKIDDSRRYNLGQTTFGYDPKDTENYGYAQGTDVFMTGIGMGPRFERTMAHEVSHATDFNDFRGLKSAEEVERSKRAIPEKDVKLMDTSRKNNKGVLKSVVNYLAAVDAPDPKRVDYLSHPTEVRARLNTLRKIGKDQGIYDPFIEEISKEQYNKLKEINEDSYLDLKEIYSDKAIMDMLNKISYTPNKDKDKKTTPFAQDGMRMSNAKMKRGVELSLKERANAAKDEAQLKRTGQLPHPRSVEYKQKAPKIAEVRKHVPQGKVSKALDIAANPLTAAGYVARGEDIPDRFTAGERNPLDYAQDVINPAGIAQALYNAPGDISEGNYLGAAVGIASALPFLKELAPSARRIVAETSPLFQDLAKAKSLKEAGRRLMYDVPVERSLPRIAPEELRALRQVQEIGRLNDTGKSFEEVLRHALDSGLPDTHIERVFNRTRQEAEEYLRDFVPAPRVQFDLTRYPRMARNTPRTQEIPMPTDPIHLDIGDVDYPLFTPEEMRRSANINSLYQNWDDYVASGVDKSLFQRVLGDEHFNEAADLFNQHNNFHLTRLNDEQLDEIAAHVSNRTNGPRGVVSEAPRPTINERLQDISDNVKEEVDLVKSKVKRGFHSSVQDVLSEHPFYRGEVKTQVPGLFLNSDRTLKNVSNKVAGATEGIQAGDVFTGSKNTSHSSWLPQMKQVFGYKGGDVQYLGSAPMNNLGYLSKYNYQPDEIAAYLNTELDELVKRGKLPDNILRPYVKGDDIRLPQYGVKQRKHGGVIEDDRGQWAHPGEVTRINSNNITMQGVNYPVLGVSDTGDTKLMQPDKNYKFKGKRVTEFPLKAKDGNQLTKLDQLTNFTNYNTPQPGGWLDKL